MSVLEITPQELAERWQCGTTELIDVRTPLEFRAVHVAHARNVPLDRLDPTALVAARRPGEPLYVVCQSGARGRQACEKLLAAGLTNVWNIAGGTIACRKSRPTRSLRPKGSFAGAAGPHRGRVAGPAWRGARLLAFRVSRAVGVCRGGSGLRRDHGHLRDGFAAGPHALEPLFAIRDAAAGVGRRPVANCQLS